MQQRTHRLLDWLNDISAISRLFLLKILNSIVIVGRACIYIHDDQVACTETSSRKLAVVDPFEQRGSKTILLTKSAPTELKPPPSRTKKKDEAPPACSGEGQTLTPAQ